MIYWSWSGSTLKIHEGDTNVISFIVLILASKVGHG